jgi:hypothetical protein
VKALILIVFLAIVATVALFVTSTNTALTVTPVKVIGAGTPVSVQVNNPHGVRRVSAFLEQNGARYQVFEKTAPARRLVWRRDAQPETLKFDVGKNKAPNLKEGKARLVVEAVSNDLRASTERAAYDVDVVMAPPRVSPDGLQHYINQAGMELVTFVPGGSWNEAGVRVGKYAFRSFPLPGRPNERFSMFAYPWDLGPDAVPVVFARNLAGTEAKAQFWYKLFPKKFRVRDFVIDDALMQKLVNSN